MNNLLHTPEGVRDVYDAECARKLEVQKKITGVLHTYGYSQIETPAFEYFDIFNKERGSVSSREMFKFFDRDNETLVLKPDMTPAISRCVAKYFLDETMPLRLCYLERTYINSLGYQGRLKETTQTGAELIGDDSPEADGEMIAMVIDSLKSVGLTEFQVELGQVDFFRGLVEEAGMDRETEDRLRELIESKNHFGVAELIGEQNISSRLKEAFLKLPELFGNTEILGEARALTDNARALAAIDRLENVYGILEIYGLSSYVTFDLGMLSKYQYYTGIIFKGYTYGTGDYIVNGGRYDKLLVQFGKDAPAVGFAIGVDNLLMALSRQKIDVPARMTDSVIVYWEGEERRAIPMAQELRAQGKNVQLLKQTSMRSMRACEAFAAARGADALIYFDRKTGLPVPVEPQKEVQA